MLEIIKNCVWSPVTVINLLLVGCFVLFKTRFRTVLNLPSIFRDTVFSIKKNRKAFSLMCTSLGGTIGVGNAIGVAGAIIEGGASAVFWMGVAGFIGMAIKYAEIYLSLAYKGPIGYIEKGVGSRAIASVYALLCIGVSFGMGNMSQVKAAVVSANGLLPFHEGIMTFIFAIVFLIVARGGLEKIRRFSEAVIPLVSLVYIFLLVFILIKQRGYLPEAVEKIKTGAGIFAGIKWAVVKRGITSGFSKAIFSSEAGLGSAGFAHTESELLPSEQAKWGVVEVFIDALICVMTAMSLLTFSADLGGVSETFMTRGMFALSFGRIGEIFYGVSMLGFAFSSIICWYYNGFCAVNYLSPKKLDTFYLISFTVLIFLSGFIGDSIILELSDIANGLMMLVNTTALWVVISKNSLTF